MFRSEIDEFKGDWRALGVLAPEHLRALRRVATIEGVSDPKDLSPSVPISKGMASANIAEHLGWMSHGA